VYVCVSLQCNLRGQWRNELGSNMTVESMNNAGFFRGSYMTAVTTQKGPVVKVSPLSGFLNINGKSTVFGFLVNWSFVESVTSWVGQCFVDSNDVEHLETMWLLRGNAESAGDDWAQTR
ncbi:AVID protein, partial [Amia calva]|nr:AVID protein [Amia calva]